LKTYVWLCALALAAPLHAETPAREKGAPPESWKDPVLSSMKVAGQRYQLERMQDWCGKESPESSAPIQKARSAWVIDHSMLLEKTPSILRAGLTPDELRDMNKKFRTDLDESEKTLAAKPPADRVKWCADAPKKIASPEMDLMNNRELVNSIAKINPAALASLQNGSSNQTYRTAIIIQRRRTLTLFYY
jgi:hypothetical protein